MLPPYTVTLAEPVPAPLACLPPLIRAPSMLIAPVIDPLLSPTVADTRRLALAPSPTWHLVDVFPPLKFIITVAGARDRVHSYPDKSSRSSASLL